MLEKKGSDGAGQRRTGTGRGREGVARPNLSRHRPCNRTFGRSSQPVPEVPGTPSSPLVWYVTGRGQN